MSNPSKQKGTKAETAVVDYLILRGQYAYRNPPAGSKDIGDVSCYDDCVIEVKDCKAMTLPVWLAELAAEKSNANATHGVVVHKRKGKGSPAEWYATMTFGAFCDLMEEFTARVS